MVHSLLLPLFSLHAAPITMSKAKHKIAEIGAFIDESFSQIKMRENPLSAS